MYRYRLFLVLSDIYFFTFNFSTRVLSEIIVEFPEGSSIIIFTGNSPNSIFQNFFNRFFAVFFAESSSVLSLSCSIIDLNLLRTQSTMELKPIDDGPGDIDIKKHFPNEGIS